jgi:hypothetical protein
VSGSQLKLKIFLKSIEMLESSSSLKNNDIQKEGENNKNDQKSDDVIEILEDDENNSTDVVAEDIQHIEEENEDGRKNELEIKGEDRKDVKNKKEDEEEDEIKVIEEKPPAAKRPKICTKMVEMAEKRRNSEWIREGTGTPVPEDPRAAKEVRRFF